MTSSRLAAGSLRMDVLVRGSHGARLPLLPRGGQRRCAGDPRLPPSGLLPRLPLLHSAGRSGLSAPRARESISCRASFNGFGRRSSRARDDRSHAQARAEGGMWQGEEGEERGRRDAGRSASGGAGPAWMGMGAGEGGARAGVGDAQRLLIGGAVLAAVTWLKFATEGHLGWLGDGALEGVAQLWVRRAARRTKRRCSVGLSLSHVSRLSHRSHASLQSLSCFAPRPPLRCNLTPSASLPSFSKRSLSFPHPPPHQPPTPRSPPCLSVLAWQFVFYLLDVALTTATWIVGKLTSSLAVANVPPSPPLPPLASPPAFPSPPSSPSPPTSSSPHASPSPPVFPSRPASRLVPWELRFPLKLCKLPVVRPPVHVRQVSPRGTPHALTAASRLKRDEDGRFQQADASSRGFNSQSRSQSQDKQGWRATGTDRVVDVEATIVDKD
ncbi:unnamed protein product [Closterium sp. Naga37s-1]|nr:unnamed protein product [Closterium sp. Naga37s-1]